MNKRDFYKEIMSEYTFDKDKILANAKKGRFAGQKSLPIYIGMTAAAAAAVVAVGTLSMTLSGGKHGAEYIQSSGSTLAALSEKERIDRALEEIRKNENSSEMHDVLVTFTRPLTPVQVQSIITNAAGGNVDVRRLYMDDDSMPSGESEVGAVFTSGEGEIKAAVINCAGYLMAKINDSPFVFLAEPIENADMNSLDLLPVTPDVGTPDGDINSKPENNSGIFGENPENNHGTSTEEPDSVPEDPNGEETSVPETNPPVTHDKLPDGVTLPQGHEKFAYITDDIGADKAYFLSDDVFYVRTADSVRLYRFDGEREVLAAEQTVSDAKVCWVSENGSRIMITGVENGSRCKMYILDANNCTINDMQIDDMLTFGTVSSAAYNESADTLAVSIFDGDYYYLYTAKLSGYQATGADWMTAGRGLVPLTVYNNAVYFAEFYENNVEIYKCSNVEYTLITMLEGSYTASVNAAFTHAVFTGADGRFIFDPASDALIPAEGEGAINFGASLHSFSLDGSYYTVSGGEIVPASGISTIAQIDFTRSLSSKYMAAVSNGSVRITQSSYSDKAKSGGITFEQPTENASAAARAAVNSGLGVINAIADRRCKESGINTAEKLTETIDVCFGTNAAAALRSRCDVRESGELHYKNGGLTAINVSDTTLVMQDSLSGTLYIKAGTFDGKTAYFQRSVKLSEENGILKLDCIID